MLKRTIIILSLCAFLLAGCQITRTRRQTVFDPNITAETRRCQQEDCHPPKEIDFYAKYKFSHNKHFSETDAKNCDACHKEKKHTKGPVEIKLKFDSCRQCHSKKSPHGSWQVAKKTHAKQANADIKSCSRCHQPLFCRTCHQVEIPHQKGWLKEHGPIVLIKGIGKCRPCHNNETGDTRQMDFCFTCHPVAMPHPKDIMETHGRLGKQIGVKKCFQCHDEQSFCTGCHKTPMPHEKSFVDNHYKEIKTLTPSSCVKCHENNVSSTGGCFGGDCHTQR